MSRHLRILGALLAAVALLGAACGDSGGNGDGATTPPDDGVTTPPDDGGTATSLVAADFEFQPTTLSVASGDSIDVENTGAVEHNFSVTDQDIAEDVDAGETITVEISLDAGTYDFFCEYHQEQMTGTLTVT